MIFWSVLILCVIGLIVGVIKDWFELSIMSVVISILWIIFVGTFVAIGNVSADAQEAELKETQRALKYKLESGSCRDEFGLLSKGFIDEIQEWNEDIVYYKEAQDDFWIGIFIPDIYDDFETIDYNEFVSRR